MERQEKIPKDISILKMSLICYVRYSDVKYNYLSNNWVENNIVYEEKKLNYLMFVSKQCL